MNRHLAPVTGLTVVTTALIAVVFVAGGSTWLVAVTAAVVSVGAWWSASRNAEGDARAFRSAALVIVGAMWWFLAAVLEVSDAIADRNDVGSLLALIGTIWVGIAVLTLTSRSSLLDRVLDRGGSAVIALAVSAVLAVLWLEPTGPIPDWRASGRIWSFATVAGAVPIGFIAVRGRTRYPQRAARLLALAVAAGIVVAVRVITDRTGANAVNQSDWTAWELLAPAALALAAVVPISPTTPEHGALPPRDRLADPGPTALRARWILVAFALAPAVAVGARVILDGRGPDQPITIAALATTVLSVIGMQRCQGRAIHRALGVVHRRAHRRLTAMLEYSNDLVVITDRAGIIRYASAGVRAALGEEAAALIGQPMVELLAEDQRPGASDEIDRLVRTGREATVEFEGTLRRADGGLRDGEVVMVNLIGDESVDGVVVTFRDVTDQRDLERRLSHRAFHDELTGLANRALFLDRMDQALRQLEGDQPPVMVLFIDLDDFKAVNDEHGHGIGDEVLRVIANRVRTCAGPADTAARLGGDEFAVLLGEEAGIDHAIDVAESILSALREPVPVADLEFVVLASIGIAIGSSGASTTSVLRDADIAMYEAKRAGKGQIRIFDPAMRQIAARHLAYRSTLASAIAEDQLRLVYLPYVDLRTGAVRGAEALVRWHHPDYGEVSPAEFVPVAERSGLMVPIGRWVLAEALRQASGWRPDEDLFVSVNVSATELRQPEFVDHVLATVQDHRFDPRQLVIEVTEAALMEDPERMGMTIARLREHGLRIALDDFGVGYVSLGYLQRHRVDLVKLDRSVTSDLGRADLVSASDGEVLTRTIVQMAKLLGLQAVAEGIERPEQLRALRGFGCALGQGHLLSAPLDEEVIAERFSEPPALVGDTVRS